MGWWDDLFKTAARRKAEQDRARRKAITQAKTAIRRERRAIHKRQAKAEELRREAVQHEREGKAPLAKQTVRQFVQIDKEVSARSMAIANMEYTLEQVQVKDNYEEFVRGMQVVANLEELAQESLDPDEVRERITNIVQKNQDLIEPWTEFIGVDAAAMPGETTLSPEEEEAYKQIVNDASASLARADSEFSAMDEELERKIDEALGKD